MRTKLIVVGAAALGLAAVPLRGRSRARRRSRNAAKVAAGDPIRAEVRNGTTGKETEIIGKFNATTGSKGGYVTRQSNTQTGSKAGGGAIYGCRGAAGGTASGSAPCLRASNLAAGFAFEFAGEGDVVGQIAVGDGKTANSKAKPFTTNATGVATGLNADQVDGKSASDIAAMPGPPNGTATGDLAGTYPNPRLAPTALGVAIGGVRVAAGGTLTAAFNRRGSTPIITHNGAGDYTVSFPGFTDATDSLPQATLTGALGQISANPSGEQLPGPDRQLGRRRDRSRVRAHGPEHRLLVSDRRGVGSRRRRVR